MRLLGRYEWQDVTCFGYTAIVVRNGASTSPRPQFLIQRKLLRQRIATLCVIANIEKPPAQPPKRHHSHQVCGQVD